MRRRRSALDAAAGRTKGQLHAVMAAVRARRAAYRNRRLQEVAEAFSEARLPTDVAAVVLTQGCLAVDAPRGVVGLLADGGTVVEARWFIGYPEEVVAAWARIPIRTATPLTDAIRSGTAVFVETAADVQARYPAFSRQAPGGALAAVPLVASGGVIGVLGFAFDDARAFDADEQAFILTVSRLCAQALDRARLFEAAAKARTDAEAANRAKDEFLATLSHELRTPLTAILGWANMLQTARLEPAAVTRGLATIERNAKAQAQLIEDLLDVGRIVAGKMRLEMRDVDPAAIVRAAVDVVRPAAEAKRVVVEATVGDAIGSVRADAGRLQQIAWNLLSNAVKFTPAGGRVEVRLDRVPAGARLRVIDTGEGITADFLPHVFERFRQAQSTSTRSRGGLGLGLAIVKHLVELHEGTITAESDGPGAGSRFTVVIPGTGDAVVDAGAAELPASVRGGPRRLDGLRVAVVDDEPDTRELVATVLRAQGAIVLEAASAQEALQAVERDPPDVLVSDIGMPNEDGYALVKKVRAWASLHQRDVPALALTAYAGVHDARMAELAGFQRHLPKPVVPARLVGEVARLAGR